ncbi:hypothetical protein P7K49_032807 [Saguinus oedipus]|uniref:Uncharacterized protein n=1 Tax=Saguinus oedipus TaxID=9490 RepID=A0ABQ9TQ42_SAGOE|nr:hypothetical protein P7K49_032807 [Saguinus oedipus]
MEKAAGGGGGHACRGLLTMSLFLSSPHRHRLCFPRLSLTSFPSPPPSCCLPVDLAVSLSLCVPSVPCSHRPSLCLCPHSRCSWALPGPLGASTFPRVSRPPTPSASSSSPPQPPTVHAARLSPAGHTVALRPARPPARRSPAACKRKEQEQQKERALQPKKQRLVTISQQLGLELNTVSNFFMNARRRCMNRWAEEPSTAPGGPAGATAAFSKA